MVQKLPLFSTFFLGNIGKENAFYDILERKNSFLGYKNQKFKKSLNLLNPWFWSTDGYFSKPFFQAIQARKMSFRIFYSQKTLSQARKTENTKSGKIDTFTKALPHGFCPKMTIILTCFFSQYRQGKCLLRYSRTKKLLSRL